MSVAALEPHIREILSAPGTNLETISAKRVRKQLLKNDDSLSEEWMKENKEQIDQLISNVFEHVSGVAAQHAANGEAGGAGWKQESDAGFFGDEDDRNAGPSSSYVEKPKKVKSKQELSDEQLARQLSSELNASSRASRSGKATNGRSKKGASRTPKKDKKSAERVDDSDAGSDDEDGGSRKRKRGGGGGGGAKGGFGKEFLLSAPLAALLDVDRLSRPQVVKQLWVHIKGNSLQNPSNRREIICDDAMRAVFNVDKIDMFKMNKVLGDHLHELEGA